VDGFVNHQTNEIVTIVKSFGAEQTEIVAYSWNAHLGELDKRIINFDFSTAQGEAEKLLFQERDFIQTILYITMLLVHSPPESQIVYDCNLGACTYYPDWYRPYMRYLLALAYELSGQTEQARDTYFGLSQDYPDNNFGLVAAHRLAPAR
jgi:hypothetical protein